MNAADTSIHRPPAHLRRRLLQTVVPTLVVVAIGAVIVLWLGERERVALATMREDLDLAAQSRSLGVLGREQYIHAAHTIILGDRSHVEHQGAWARAFADTARRFSSHLPVGERPHLDRILAESAALQRIFLDELLPAVDAHDSGAIHAAHERAEESVAQMIGHADALGESFEHRAEATAGTLRDRTRAAALASAVLALVVLVAALATVRRFWTSLMTPLVRLQAVTDRVAHGDVEARVPPLEIAELDEVARAFNLMLDRLADRERDLLRASRLATLGRVAAGVAHEINNPISVIRGYVKTMLRDVPEGELRNELQIVDDEAFACQRIAEDLVTYASGPSTRLERDVDATLLIGESVAKTSLGADVESKGVQIECDAEPCTIECDPVRMRQVITNLVRNAVHASPEGGTVSVRGVIAESNYRIEVADAGPGIPQEIRSTLFEPFVSANPGGTGLGLAVCEGILRSHHGTVRAVDRDTGGTIIEVVLPRRQSEAAA